MIVPTMGTGTFPARRKRVNATHFRSSPSIGMRMVRTAQLVGIG
jgi:hypothetical protein